MTDLAALRREAVERAEAHLRSFPHVYSWWPDGEDDYLLNEIVRLAIDASGLLAHIERLEAVVEAARAYMAREGFGSAFFRGQLEDALDNLNEQPVPEQS